MTSYNWPGNTRELEATVETIVASLAPSIQEVGMNHLPGHFLGAQRLPAFAVAPNRVFILPEGGVNLKELQSDLILQAVERTRGNKTKAAKVLGLSRDALRSKV